MQHIVDRLWAADLFGLNINISKTELLYQPSPMFSNNMRDPQPVTVHGEPLKSVKAFTYLGTGSTVTYTNSSDLEVERRIQSAIKAFGSLEKRLWSCHNISYSTKVKVYNAAVLPCLLYATECLTLYSRHIKILTRVQLRHLRAILQIRWQDRIPDVEVIQRAGSVSVEALITSSQLRWAGHVRQMSDNRLPKAVFYAELKEGKRSRGGQKLRFKDVLKRHMRNTGISPESWEEQALQREKWQRTLKTAVAAVEKKRQKEYEKAHERRHYSTAAKDFVCSKCHRCCRSRAGLLAHMRACLQ